MRKSLRTAMSLAFCLAVCAGLAGQRAMADDEPKPVVTIVFAGYDAVMEHIKAVSEIAGRPEWASAVQGGISLATQGKGLKGLDKSRPWGIFVYAGENEDWPIQGYVPVDDLKQLMKTIPSPDGEIAADDDGIYELPGGKPFFAQQKGKWAHVSNSKDGLKTAIEDPMPAISDLAKKYVFAAKVSLKNVPDSVRDKYLPLLRMSMDNAMRQQGNETEEQTAAKAAYMKRSMQELERFLKELEDFTIGVGFDKEAGSLFYEVELRVKEGSELAKQVEGMKGVKTNFSGLRSPESAVNIAVTQHTSAEEIKTRKLMVDYYRESVKAHIEDRDDLNKDQQKVAKEIVTDIFEVLGKTAGLDRTDFGVRVDLGDKGPSLVGGGLIADGEKLEATAKKLLAEVGKESPEVEKMIKLDAEKYEDLNFHVATIPVKDTEAAKILGETTEVALALNDSTLYLAAGKDPVGAIKRAIDSSKKTGEVEAVPTELRISLLAIAKFVADNSPDESAKEMAKKLADAASKAEGKDHVILTGKVIPNGTIGRLTIESGVLKAIGAAVPGAPAPSE